MEAHSLVHLHAAGTSVLFDTKDEVLSVLYWGADLGELGQAEGLRAATTKSVANSSSDEPLIAGILRENSRGFLGQPALSGHRNGQSWSTHFVLKNYSHNGNHFVAELVDAEAQLRMEMALDLSPQGILKWSAVVTNTGSDNYTLNQFTYWLPLADRAREVLDFTGRWSHERHPQRRGIVSGLTSRESREGRSGHDYTIAQIALSQGANFSQGDAWALSLAWSGNSVHHIERMSDGTQSIGAGELLLPGEMQLAPGGSYMAPSVIANYSSSGIDGLSDHFHSWLRARPNHPTNIRPRPLTLNVWEAVYFAHDAEKIKEITDAAAAIGIERMVLDDGWFHDRRHDRAGLGDWVVDPVVWPEGLAPIIEYINARGIEFGLWFEGEMVNPDSDLYRAHPEWILHVADRTPPLWRNQLVLDLTHPGAFDHVLGQTDAILSEYNIAYIKWDHNRALIEPGHFGQAAVHNQTLAIYRLFAELKLRHPHLEIESCASGGGRIDLGVIDLVDRFWTSDNNDALERQTIQRWTSVVIPPELLGTHIGPTHGHQTARTHEISFRAVNAFFGHAGIEWDITEADAGEIKILKSWANLYKEKRDMLHSGRTIRVDHPDQNAFLYGVVAKDQSEAIFAYVQHRMNESTFPAMALIPGLEPTATYEVKVHDEVGKPRALQVKNPPWLRGIKMTGAALANIGVRPPILAPENAILIGITRVG
ncbi:MAG: alpha-galactosidase [Actinomycetes bacterium]